ncbi:NEDD8 ultimate buster 1-like [Cylas formicarius]|uniref:NEDD8 ultimate buster 1-like n=1 Tax=Cylas formicarius TaxID=197179 RepID=UPI0029583753|nr:NEDD8 ultimate buster 1-like [Cylas formicarius]
MDNCTQKEDFLIQIRDKLRKDGVKLWQFPYYIETMGVSDIDIKNLAEQFGSVLEIPFETCLQIIQELQINSLENLKHINRFHESGLATLKIKVLRLGTPLMLTIELMLTSRVLELKERISQHVSTPSERIKLISAGKVLNNSDNLINQGIKNGHQLLAVTLDSTPSQVMENENKIKQLENIKKDSQMLALDDDYMGLEDQYGNSIKIPEHEKESLIIAMTLHEKGRSVLKREDYSTALILFLEADHHFRNCNSSLLNAVDNYALLDLDIAWCYLCLQSLTHLPEAYDRLQRCEQKLNATYGRNLERLVAVKGSSGNEACFFLRLHLLQAIVLYHQNKRTESLALLKKVENEMQNLKVDENDVLTLAELGYTLEEARIGLRASGGDINMAVNYITEQRQKRQESRKKARAQRILEKEMKKLGKCADGIQFVNPNFLNILVNMGYNKEVARRALQKSNNIISDSIQFIQDNPQAGTSDSKSTEFMSLIDDLVSQLVEAGFDPRMAKIALQKHDGDVLKSAEELLANDGLVAGDLTEFNIRSESIEEIKQKKIAEELKEQAFNRLKEDISITDDDHLDFNLVQEELFLKQYLSLLDKS